MSAQDAFDVAAYVAAAAEAAGLRLDPAHRPGVIANMERIAQMAKLVMDFPLDETTEPLPQYRP